MTAIVRFLFLWISTKVIADKVFFDDPSDSSSSMSPLTFRCNNGKYIDRGSFCDEISDCDDLSDITFGCDRQACGAASFKCYSDGVCLDISTRCNTIKECRDGSDELNCGDETDIENCLLQKGKYLCDDKMKCLDFKYTCDGMCNCLDCSDETEYCNVFDRQLCKPCPQYCLPTPKGTKCVCNSTDYETNKLCREIENCTGSLFCSQYCSRYKNVTRCLCYDDHHEIPDDGGIKCRNNIWLKNILLYSTATKIKMVNITGKMRAEIIQKEVNCTILAAAKNYLYYVTHRDNKEIIFKTEMDHKKIDKVMELNSTIKSLAVDWISSNLYFTSDKSLWVCSNDGRICSQLKCCVVDVFALAPRFGWMFYTQNMAGEEERMIMKSNMDGSNEATLLDLSFYKSISLAVDEWTETVYWSDSEFSKLYSASLNGLNIKEYSIMDSRLSIRFCVLERHLFFTGKQPNRIYFAEGMNFKDLKVYIDEDTNNIRDLFAYNPRMQFTYKIENPCANSSCKSLCLLRSEANNNGLNYTCICENFNLTNNNPWCYEFLAGRVLQIKSLMKQKTQTDSLTVPSLESDATISSIAESSLGTPYPSVEIFNILSCLAFVFSIFTLCLSIRNNFSCRQSQQNINFIMDEIEL